MIRFVTILVVLAAMSTYGRAAEIIVDDFTDPARAEQWDGWVSTPVVGDLGATREMLISGTTFRDTVVGGLEVDGTYLTATLDYIAQEVSGVIPVFYTVRYTFDPTDITRGGINNGVLVDFESMTADVAPTEIRAFLAGSESNTSLVSRQVAPLSDSPFTYAFPFDSFTRRDGSIVPIKATSIDRITLEFWYLNVVGDVNFQAKIDRIRVSSIPEPGALVILAPIMCILPAIGNFPYLRRKEVW